MCAYAESLSEYEAVQLSTRGPVTAAWLARDLTALGVRPGMLLMVHCALSRLGWVIGGPATVVAALREAVGDGGTLLLPAFCGDNSDPREWQHPPVPEAWWAEVRAELPAYDPATSPTRGMGVVPEYFLRLPGVQRSAHPQVSWAGLGPLAGPVLAGHQLDHGLGENGPLARCYEQDGWVLSLATQRTTVLHLAEYRAQWPGQRFYRQGSAVLADGRRRWVEYEVLHTDNADFEQLRQDYLQAAQARRGTDWQEAPVAYGTARLFRIQPLVDYAADWISAHRS
jgi:aminoglycoside 3-N-acetyltransferase